MYCVCRLALFCSAILDAVMGLGQEWLAGRLSPE